MGKEWTMAIAGQGPREAQIHAMPPATQIPVTTHHCPLP
jgi:hypothetical protein